MPISYPISEFVVADTGVFWDIAYCPIPNGLTPEKIYHNIKLALKNMGYYGKVSIYVYGDENLNPKDIETTGIKCVFTGDEQTRVDKIIHDLTFWGIRKKKEERRANVMLIAGSKAKDPIYVKFLGYLRSINTNILLAQPEKLPNPIDEASGWLLRYVSEVWIWNSLAAGEKPIYGADAY
ncbi:unnamed protein product [Eruca vesicaria subsp. sativa]|uniref:NYN domain-containing protein n=1 Tax=Eruca vesicaria subsp. sativa TaxID=29727 RepID=A0ABC8LGK1_ERUVS|nr:unnamed protein product [Eruca vesicaria subsp. sativa]